MMQIRIPRIWVKQRLRNMVKYILERISTTVESIQTWGSVGKFLRIGISGSSDEANPMDAKGLY